MNRLLRQALRLYGTQLFISHNFLEFWGSTHKSDLLGSSQAIFETCTISSMCSRSGL